MRLNDADLIYCDEPIDSVRKPIRPLSAVGEKLSLNVHKVALVTKPPDDHRRLAETLNEAVRANQLSRNTIRHSSRARVINMMTNLSTDEPQRYLVSPPTGQWTGVLVCGASRQLLDEVDYINRARAKGVLIIATNRAVVALVRIGIYPDLVFAAESKDRDGQLERIVKTVFDLTSHPANTKRVDDPMFISTADPAFDELPRIAGLPCYVAGPSVTTVMITWALSRGFKSIGLVGVDLAFRSNSAPEENYVPDANKVTKPRTSLVPVIGWDGTEMQTTVQMADEADWIGRIYLRSGVRLCDAHRLGARKRYVIQGRLGDEVILKDHVIGSDEPHIIPRDTVIAYWDRMRRRMDVLKKAVADNDVAKVLDIKTTIPLLDTYINADILAMRDLKSSVDRKEALFSAVTAAINEISACIR